MRNVPRLLVDGAACERVRKREGRAMTGVRSISLSLTFWSFFLACCCCCAPQACQKEFGITADNVTAKAQAPLKHYSGKAAANLLDAPGPM